MVRGGGGGEGGGQTFPYCVCVEGVEEFDGAACEEGGEDSVDGAVDVVEGEEVQQVVGGGVFPGLDQGAGLGRHGGLGDEDAFLVGGVRNLRGCVTYLGFDLQVGWWYQRCTASYRQNRG